MYQNLALIALFSLAYSLVAGRLGRTAVNGAVVYLAFGVIAGPVGLGWLDLSIEGEGIRTLAELTLALVLFTDAASADMAVVRRAIRLPGRMLLVGLPLTILLGVGFGVLLFPGLAILEVAVLATLLAPTDAALGKANRPTCQQRKTRPAALPRPQNRSLRFGYARARWPRPRGIAEISQAVPDFAREVSAPAD